MNVRNLKFSAMAALSGALLVGCGDSKLGDQIEIILDPLTQTARVELDMADGLEVSMDGKFDIANGYGSIYLQRATKTENAKIVVELHVSQVIGDPLGGLPILTQLPNGAPLPVSMTPPLFKVPVTKQGSFTLDALFALNPELQVGALVGISHFNSNVFPIGVSICQNFRNSDRIAFASVCLYGPGSQGSGGIFVGGNFGDVLGLDDFIPELISSPRHALMAVSAADQVSSVQSDVQAKSRQWSEQRHDPRRRLSGSNGSRALRNAENILKVRR
jgi:hypothetical protein